MTPTLQQRHLDALDNVIRAFQMLGKHISVLPLVELAAILRAMQVENERLGRPVGDRGTVSSVARAMREHLGMALSRSAVTPADRVILRRLCDEYDASVAATPPQAPAVPAEPVPRKSSYGLPEDIERKIHLWFFRDLDEPLRFKLFRLFEMHEDEMEPMGRQSRALNSLLYSLRTAPAPQPAVPDALALCEMHCEVLADECDKLRQAAVPAAEPVAWRKTVQSSIGSYVQYADSREDLFAESDLYQPDGGTVIEPLYTAPQQAAVPKPETDPHPDADQLSLDGAGGVTKCRSASLYKSAPDHGEGL